MSDRTDHPWTVLHEWWLEEVTSDPAYEDEVTPLVLTLLRATGRVLDVGCGEGRLMRSLVGAGSLPTGVDISWPLLKRAAVHGPVVLGDLPSLDWCVDHAFDAAVVSLVLEHIPDHQLLLSELGRVVRTGGHLVLVMNHPIYTAPESAPIQETDGEVLWRPGEYFGSGYTDEPAGPEYVRFHHRTLSALLSDAAAVGWDLQELYETGASAAQIDRHPPLALQKHIPRLLGVRWRRR